MPSRSAYGAHAAVAAREIVALRDEIVRLAARAPCDDELATTLGRAQYGVLLADVTGRLTMQSFAAERIWAGRAAADTIADWSRYRGFHPDGRPLGPGEWQMARCLSERTSNEPEEIRIQRFDGSLGLLLGTSAPLYGPDGELSGAVSVFADITHLEQVEEDLGFAQEQLAATLRSIGDAVIATDPEGRVTFMNPVAEELTGWTAEDAKGQPLRAVFQILDEATREEVASPVDAVMREGGIVGLTNHTILIRKDGTEIAIDDSAAPIRSLRGQLAGVVLVFRDVSVKRRQEALESFVARASETLLMTSLDYEERLTTIAQLAVPGFADWAAVDMLQPDGSVRRLATAHTDPTKIEMVLEIERRWPTDPSSTTGIPNVIRTGTAELMADIPDEVWQVAARSPEHLAAIRALGLRSFICAPLAVHGRTLGAISFVNAESKRRYGARELAIAEDLARRAALAIDHARLYRESIEARLEAEASLRALRQEQARLATVLDQLPAGVMIAEAPSGKVVYANQQAAEIFAGPVDRVENTAAYQTAFEVWHPDGRPCPASEMPLLRAVAGEVVAGQEVMFRRRDGRVGVVRANAAPIRDESGVVVGAVTAYYDATEIHRAAEERERLYAQAQGAIRSRDHLLAVVSHDLRTPLGAIALTAGLLRHASGDPEGVEKTRAQGAVIQRSTERMGRLIADLLDLASIESGGLTLARGVHELGALLQQAVELMAPLASDREIRLTLEDVPPHAQVLCDRDRVVQVLSNLIGNAIKFASRGGSVVLRAALTDQMVTISVADDGPGIAESDLPHLFDRYWQSREAAAHGGVGLGLSIAKSLVEAGGGRIWVESSPRGATFAFTVPVA